MNGQNKRKLAFVVAGIAMFVVWGAVVIPSISGFIDTTEWVNPIVAWIVWNIPLIIAMNLMIIAVFGWGKRSLLIALGLYFLYITFDYYEPPLSVNPAGEFISRSGGKASVDYVVAWVIKTAAGDAGWLYNQVLGVTVLWIFTYVVVPIIIFSIAIYIVPYKILRRELVA